MSLKEDTDVQNWLPFNNDELFFRFCHQMSKGLVHLLAYIKNKKLGGSECLEKQKLQHQWKMKAIRESAQKH